MILRFGEWQNGKSSEMEDMQCQRLFMVWIKSKMAEIPQKCMIDRGAMD
jgi:hypothetical protein